MIYTSPYPSVGKVSKENVISQYFRDAQRPDNDTAFTEYPSNKSVTNKQVKDGVFRYAHVLASKHNVKKNDVVMLSTLNSLHLQAIHMGTILLGGIVSPCNIMYNAEELAHQIRMTKPKLFIVSDFNLENVTKGLEIAGHKCEILKLSDVGAQIDSLIADSSAPEAKPVEVDAYEQHAYYCFSSGTSGLPKGVMTTQMNIYVNALQQAVMKGPLSTAGKTYGAPLPMSHIYGLGGFIWALPFIGKHMVLFPKFDFKQCVQGIIEHKIEVFFVVPPIIVALAKVPEIEPLIPKLAESLKLLQSGAAPLSDSAVEVFKKRFPNVGVVQGYGMTEMSPVSHNIGESNANLYNRASVGWLIPDTEMRLIDPETGKDAAKGGRGELWIRGPQVMKGYLNNKEATDECLLPGGWLRTGDVGVVDEHGQCYIVDRIKELIKSKGHQVAPAELEGLLLQHPNVNDAVVVGVPDADGTTERPRAYVVLSQGADPNDVVRWFNKKVSVHKRLWGGLVKVDAVEKNASGKILRKGYRGRKDTEVYGEKLAKL